MTHEEFFEFVRKELKKVGPKLKSKIEKLDKSKAAYLELPFVVHGVICLIRYDVKAKMFDQIEVPAEKIKIPILS